MKSVRLIFVFLFMAFPLIVSAEKAKTIDELAKIYDSSQCKECHEDIYLQWEKSHHARPLMGVKGGLMLSPLAMKGGTAFSPEDPKKATAKNYPCFKCHLPQGVTSAEDSVAVELTEALLAAGDAAKSDKEKADAKAKVAKLQITCITCHSDKAILHRRELGEPQKGVLYSSRAVSEHGDKVYKKVEKSIVMKDSLYCGQCHGLGPNLEFDQPFQCANLYGSYLHNYISSGGTKTCQDCHMQKGDHLIAPNWNDDKGSTELLKKALALDVETLGYDWLRKAKTYVSKVVVNTTITSTAGHRVPDG